MDESQKKEHSRIGYYPGCDVRNNVISYLESHLTEFPDRIALRWVPGSATAAFKNSNSPLSLATQLPHQEITYRDFAHRIAQFARGLLDINIQPGHRVIIFLPMSLDMYIAMFAVQRIGAVAVFLDSWARSHHLGATAACVTPRAMISFHQAFVLVNQVPEFASMPIQILYGPGSKTGEGSQGRADSLTQYNFQDLFSKKEAAPIAAVNSDSTALITFTTGSTGAPKGANRTHQFLSAQHQALERIIPYLAADVDMPAFPIFSLNNLASGVTTVLPALDLASPSEHDSALLASQLIHEHINCTTLSPSMLANLIHYLEKLGLQLPELTRVVTGGAPISKDVVNHFYQIAPNSELWILYGSTEAEPMAHIEGREMLRQDDSKDPEVVEEGVNVGQISDDLDFKFIKIVPGPIDLHGASWLDLEVPRGQVGEFICTGDHVCKNYYNNPGAFTGAKILGEDQRVWHRTGDLAYIDAKNNLWIVGRINNAITRRGEYFFPVRPEVLLKRLPWTSRCAFLGMPENQETKITGFLPNDGKNQATAAVIELHREVLETSFDFKVAIQEIRRIFAKNKIPLDQIYFVREIPMDPRHHSKVEYAQLRKALLEGNQILAKEVL